jgi:hypothetical protein
VQLTLTGAASSTTVSDANGNYAFSNLTAGAYIVSPSSPGAAFAPANAALSVQNQAVATGNFTRTPGSYASTQLIAAYMVTLHAQSRSTFLANEGALINQQAAIGFGGNALALSGQDFLGVAQGFIDGSLAFVRLEAQSMAIDSAAVSALLSTYAAQDVSYATTYYQGAPWNTFSAAVLGSFVTGLSQNIDSIYALAVLQLP